MTELMDVLATADIFKNLPRKHLKNISSIVEIREYPKGVELVREGTFTRDFFVILEGSAVVTLDGRKRDSLGSGEFFGELALLTRSARTATVTTTSPTRVATLDAQAFRDLLESEPKIALYILDVLARRFEHLVARPPRRVSS